LKISVHQGLCGKPAYRQAGLPTGRQAALTLKLRNTEPETEPKLE